MNNAAIVLSIIGAGVALAIALVRAGAGVAAVVRGWSGEVAALREEIAKLRQEMIETRMADRERVADLIRAHRDECLGYRASVFAPPAGGDHG